MNPHDRAIQEARRDEAVLRLRDVLRALATTSERQKALFPGFGQGEELALEFDNWYHLLLTHTPDEPLPAEAMALLAQIDGVFDRMVDSHEHVWSAHAPEREEWATLRDLAAQALRVLGEPGDEPPPPSEGGTADG